MATKVSLQNIVESTNSYEIDFLYFKISGKAELNARLTFLSITEMDRYNVNPYVKFLDCLDAKEKEVIKSMEVEDATAFIESKILKGDYPPIESIANGFIKAFAENKCVYINKLFINLIRQSIQNQTFSIEFFVDNDEDGISVEQKEHLAKEINSLDTLPDIADLVFSYYKKDSKSIYMSFVSSVISFLEKLK